MKKIKNYICSIAAVSAVAFALLVPVVVGGAGMSIDVATAYLVRARLSHALDAAALAGGIAQGDGDVQAVVEQFFAQNYPPEKIGATYDLTVFETDGGIHVSGRAYFDTAFMRFLGIDRLDVYAEAEVTKPARDIELAMVLDVTGSMSGSRITDLKTAAKEMVDTVVQDDQSGAYSRVALVPYSMGVNVGSYANQVRGTYTGGTCTSPGCQYYRFRNPYGDSKTFQISTCVSERTGVEAYTDVAPSTAYVGRNYPSGNNPCLSSKIVPLTSDKDYLEDQINAFTPAGSTAGQIGLAWVWYLVSPNFAYLWPENENRPDQYGREDLVKIVVLMTDGEFNTTYCRGVISQDSGSGSGSTSDKINCNATNGNAYNQAEQLCTAMKEDNIIIYTIGFDISNSTTVTDFMRNCATDENHAYFAEDGEELQQVFRDIARNVLSIYLSR